MIVFETIQEDEIKILNTSSSTPDWEPHLIEAPRFLVGKGAQFFRNKPAVCPCPLAENWNHPSISSKLCLHIFYSASVSRGSQDFGQEQFPP